ncbi:hypothetical protein [Nocardia sp. NPDC057668]|uniref:hypothetical protein n=1 Tax=Nocardia sp. NPDC057668 TaxID=3346202 RepID=UPI00366ECB8A
MNTAEHGRSGATAAESDALANSAGPQGYSLTASSSGQRRGGFLTRLSTQFGSRGLARRGPDLDEAARRELLLHGSEGIATVLSVRAPGPDSPGAGDRHEIRVRVRLSGRHPYETRVRQRMTAADLEWTQPGDTVACRVDPGDPHRVVVYVPAPGESARANIAKILSDGRRARATVLTASPVAADYSGREDPVLRLDLELRAWDEPGPWRVRLTTPVPLAALELIDLGGRLEVAFFTVDRGESVAVDWAVSRALPR